MDKKQDTDNSKEKEQASPLPVSNYTPVRDKLVSLVIDRLLNRWYIGAVRWDNRDNLYSKVEKGVGRTNGYSGFRETHYEITGIIKKWFRTYKYHMGYIYLGHNDDDTINSITVNIHGTCTKNRRFAQDIKDLFPTVEVEVKSTSDSAYRI